MNRIQHTVGQFRPILQGHLPGQVVIQLTDRCNATCPQCGMHASASFKRSTVASDHLKRCIDYAAMHNIQALSITGGEPLLLLDTVAELLRYAGRAGIRYLRTGTNGYFFKEPSAPDFLDRVKRVVDTLADTPLRNLWISLDSAVPEVHEKMRGFPGIVSGIEKALPIFHERGIYPSVNLGINRYLNGRATYGITPELYGLHDAYLQAFYQAFSTGMEHFYARALSLGFTMANVCYPMSISSKDTSAGLQAVYEATAEDRVVSFDDTEKGALFSALLQVVPRFRSRLRLFSPCVSLYALQQFYCNGRRTHYPCRGGYDFFFISAHDGNTYPCGYRGRRNLGPLWEMEPRNADPLPQCSACDWECFRDPSELLGPLSDLVSRPWRVFGKFLEDKAYFKLWWQDVRYFHSCEYFDGRRPPNLRRLSRHGTAVYDKTLAGAEFSEPEMITEI